MDWTSDDLLAVATAPLALFTVLRVLRILYPRVPSWPASYLAAVWAAVLGTLAVLVLLSVTVKAVLVAWIFTLLGAWNLTRAWLAARRNAGGPSAP